MCRSRLVLLSLLILLAGSASAQRAPRPQPGGTTNVPNIPARQPEVSVRVLLDNGRPAGEQLYVELVEQSGVPVARAFTDSNGKATFRSISGGSYRIKVTGPNINDTEGATFYVEKNEAMHSEIIEVHPKDSPTATGPGAKGTVNAHDLMAPDKARKEYEKGVGLLQKNEPDKAREHLEKAIQLYANYDSAYNALGTTYAMQKDMVKAEETFRQGLLVNPSNPSLERQVGRILIQQKKFSEAEDMLGKSVTLEPQNEMGVVLLGLAQLEQNKLPQAYDNVKRVHSMTGHSSALAHLVAAKALEGMQRRPEAANEYKLYLKEAPDSPSAQVAKEALQHLDASK